MSKNLHKSSTVKSIYISCNIRSEVENIPNFKLNLSKQKLLSKSYKNMELIVYVVMVLIKYPSLQKSRSKSIRLSKNDMFLKKSLFI